MSDIFDLFRKIETAPAVPSGPPAFLLVGLGNPGAEYLNTRHNAGFSALDHIAAKHGVRIDRGRFRALTGEGMLAGQKVLFLKPQTYMNLSGEAVREAAAFYRIAPPQICVLSDDIHLDVGRLRVREKGSDGGHNGLKNILEQLGSDAFARVRIGVGEKPHPQMDLADWVLSAFTEEENTVLRGTFDRIEQGITYWLAGNMASAMQYCNGK